MENKSEISCIMDEAAVKKALKTISQEIYEKHTSTDELCIIGIRRRGAALAKGIADSLTELSGGKAPLLGELDVTLYRDDFATLEDLPLFFSTNIPFDINNKTILIVDDVLFTGRTARAALDAVFLLGRPARIELAVLVDRGHRELPIEANYIGCKVDTKRVEYVRVKTPRFDGETGVYLTDHKKQN